MQEEYDIACCSEERSLPSLLLLLCTDSRRAGPSCRCFFIWPAAAAEIWRETKGIVFTQPNVEQRPTILFITRQITILRLFCLR